MMVPWNYFLDEVGTDQAIIEANHIFRFYEAMFVHQFIDVESLYITY